jgi:hypothetical protein
MQISADDVLSIAVDNTQTLERYSRDIDQEYISQQDTFFQNVFEKTKDIYDYLKAEINEVVQPFLLLDYEFNRRQ